MVPLPALTSGLMRGFAEDTDDALRGRRIFVIKVTRPDMFPTDETVAQVQPLTTADERPSILQD